MDCYYPCNGGSFILSVSLSLSLHRYKNKLSSGKVSYGRGLIINVLQVFIASLVAGLFQIIYVQAINPNYSAMLKKQDQRAMENIGMDASVIEQILMESYTNWALFSNTFIYFLLIGLFVSLLVAAYFYKWPA